MTSPCPRAPQPAPPDGVTGRRPFGERDAALSTRRADIGNRCHGTKDFSLIPRHFSPCRFLRAGSKRGEFVRIKRIFVGRRMCHSAEEVAPDSQV